MRPTMEFAPKEPSSLEEAGLIESQIEQLVLKILYYRGDLYGQDLADAIGLRFSVIQDIVETLKLKHHIQVRRSLGMGTVGAVLGLTEAGRILTREMLEAGQYAGAAPVPLSQYTEQVRRQRPLEGWLTKAALTNALKGMVITEQVLSQVGPAISSGKSMLVYGKPGDGKSYLIESLNNLEGAPVFVPHAIDCQGTIVRVFDPVYHERITEDDEHAGSVVGGERSYDRRWVKCRRPFIVTGGELTLDMLDLRYNATSKVYEAPFQLKANNGIYLIDDFGRQLAAPAEVLNRWIIPMERRVDYLSFMTGGKMTAPFEAFLVFSTNLKPEDLGDEAFLRRIQYKLLLRGPAMNEFMHIFENVCVARKLPYQRQDLEAFVDKNYRQCGRAYRRCHPRDLLTHAVNRIHFEKLPYELTAQVLERAFESCFVQDEAEQTPEHAVIAVTSRPVLKPCAEYWQERLKNTGTQFGKLALLAAFRDSGGSYRDAAAARLYEAAELSATLATMHVAAFRQWLSMQLEKQNRDLTNYLSTSEGRVAFLSHGMRGLGATLTPEDAEPVEKQLFHNDLATLLSSISQNRQNDTDEPGLIQRIA
ncbi:MAG: ATP-binding protein [Candidatus Solibacter sp.]